MSLIDRIGRFRGIPTQGVMDVTKNGFPQFIVQLMATELYDEATGEWIDWSGYQQTMTAYLVLFNASKALLNYEQVMKAFNWDGANLNALQTTDFGDLEIQFEVRENEWPTGSGKISLRIEWIDTYDSNPTGAGGGDLTPMDTGKLNSLAAKYGHFMKSAPKPKLVRGGDTPSVPAMPRATAPVVPIAPEVPATAPAVAYSQQDAWAFLNENNDGTGDIPAAWLSAIDSVVESSGIADIAFTNSNWGEVVVLATDLLSG